MDLSDLKSSDWQEQAYQHLLNESYYQAASLYEAAIECEPEVKSHYWNLGLMLLLQGQETEAQTTWLLAMAEGEIEEVGQWTVELVKVLEAEAERREALTQTSVAWAIRQHIREIDPTDLDNLLHLIILSIKLGTYTGEELSSFGVIDLLESNSSAQFNPELLMQALEDVLNYAPLHPQSLEFTKACIAYVSDSSSFIYKLLYTAVNIAFIHSQPGLGVKFAELGLQLEPENLELLHRLAILYQDSGNAQKGIDFAKRCYSLSEKIADKVYGNHLILRGLMHAGGKYSAEINLTLERHETLLKSLIELRPLNLSQARTISLFSTLYYFPYLRDYPKENNYLRQKIAGICQNNIENYAGDQVRKYRQKWLSSRKTASSNRPLKIGYFSHCLKVHSVGWLARWLFQYHNSEKFQVYAYLVNSKGRIDPLQDWYISNVYKAYQFPVGHSGFTEEIFEDELDILIDLDSITLDATCEVMAVKLAPVQITWLGWDSSEVPAIDYYIADPYVLPENAQDYYSETIWRLPQTYLAVDGFEVAVPTLRREDLNIPGDAIIYLSSQTGYKYNPDTTRLQLKILKEVPNSYFLIKGLSNQELIREFFLELAEEEGVNPDRLRFLSGVPTSAIHRANLTIADVVLDTFPYNGATTTMETLWMEVPMVTRVGQQFASRNSYTMMVNAGINEGIAWTDEEYVEWGIRLGTDEALRREVAWKLRKSKQTAPLWNGKQFTREMEKAYQQMWQIYLDSRG